MGIIRAFGLVFFLTLLVGGCVLANSSTPQVETTERNTIEITWDTALGYLQAGEVQTISQTEYFLIMVLKDGVTVSATIPDTRMLEEELIRCGSICDNYNRLNS